MLAAARQVRFASAPAPTCCVRYQRSPWWAWPSSSRPTGSTTRAAARSSLRSRGEVAAARRAAGRWGPAGRPVPARGAARVGWRSLRRADRDDGAYRLGIAVAAQQLVQPLVGEAQVDRRGEAGGVGKGGQLGDHDTGVECLQPVPELTV